MLGKIFILFFVVEISIIYFIKLEVQLYILIIQTSINTLKEST